MKYPKLVRKSDCKTPVKVTVFSKDLGEDGEQITYGTIETYCNYQSSGKRVIDDKQQLIDVTGVALFSDDIFSTLSEITHGEVEIFGEKREIIKGSKARNPDGTVNFVRLELK
jgi:hypothetical protein